MLQEGGAINNYHERPRRARVWSRGGGANRRVRVESIEAPHHGRARRHLRVVELHTKVREDFNHGEGPSWLKVTLSRRCAKQALTHGKKTYIIGTLTQIS